MKLWKKNGKLIVDENHHPILCDECPCNDSNVLTFEYGNEVYFPRIYGTRSDVYGEYSASWEIKLSVQTDVFLAGSEQFINSSSWDGQAISVGSVGYYNPVSFSGNMTKTFESQYTDWGLDPDCEYTGREIGYYDQYINGKYLNTIDTQQCSAYLTDYPESTSYSTSWSYTFFQDNCKNAVNSNPKHIFMTPIHSLSGWRFLVPASVETYMSTNYGKYIIAHSVGNQFYQRVDNYNDRPYIEIRGDSYMSLENWGIPVYGSPSQYISEEACRANWNHEIELYEEMKEYHQDDPEWDDPMWFSLTGRDFPQDVANCNILSSNFDQVFPFYDNEGQIALPLGRRDAYLSCTSGLFKRASGEMFVLQGTSTSHCWFNIHLGL